MVKKVGYLINIPLKNNCISNAELSAPFEKITDIIARVKRLRLCVFPAFHFRQSRISYRTFIVYSVYGNFLRETVKQNKRLISQVCIMKKLADDSNRCEGRHKAKRIEYII